MKKNGKRKKERTDSGSNIKTYFLCIPKSLIIFALLFFIAGFVCYKTGLSKEYYYLAALGVTVICSLSSGFSYGRRTKKNGITNGIVSVLPIALIISVLSLILSSEGATAKLPVAVISIILSGAIGGVTGVNAGR